MMSLIILSWWHHYDVTDDIAGDISSIPVVYEHWWLLMERHIPSLIPRPSPPPVLNMEGGPGNQSCNVLWYQVVLPLIVTCWPQKEYAMFKHLWNSFSMLKICSWELSSMLLFVCTSASQPFSVLSTFRKRCCSDEKQREPPFCTAEPGWEGGRGRKGGREGGREREGGRGWRGPGEYRCLCVCGTLGLQSMNFHLYRRSKQLRNGEKKINQS